MQSSFALGSIVEIYGLQTKTYLNGCRGEIKSGLSEEGRMRIEIAEENSIRSVHIKIENIRACAAAADDNSHIEILCNECVEKLNISHAKISPTTSELQDALRNITVTGFKNIYSALRDSHPTWEISAKRVKSCLKELKSTEHGTSLTVECTVCFEPMFAVSISFHTHVATPSLTFLSQLNPNGTRHLVPMVLKACGHTFCDRQVNARNETWCPLH
jgi:hypothetical protein